MRLMLLRVRWRVNRGHAGNLMVGGCQHKIALLLLPLSPDKFYNPELLFGQDDKDNNYDIGKDLQE